MPRRTVPFVNGHYYHIFNRGTNKQAIYTNESDYRHFLELLFYYQLDKPKPSYSLYRKRLLNKGKDLPKQKIVEVLSYCLMPNHFHFLLKQLTDGGISTYIGEVANGYTKYVNLKHNRSGRLFQGEFKGRLIENDEELLHVSRYIHLNPYTARLTNDPFNYPYSSYPEYTTDAQTSLCNPEVILNLVAGFEAYKNFVTDYASYACELDAIKYLRIDD